MLAVHLAFTTANSVHLCTADYLISLSDTDTNSEHLPIADIANRESIHMWEGQLNSLILIAWQVQVCTPNKLYLFPFNIQTSQRSMTSLSPRLLGCLARDLNYGTWQVTIGFEVGCNSCVHRLDDRSVVRLNNYNYNFWKTFTQMRSGVQKL